MKNDRACKLNVRYQPVRVYRPAPNPHLRGGKLCQTLACETPVCTFRNMSIDRVRRWLDNSRKKLLAGGLIDGT